MDEVEVYSYGLFYASVCAPRHLSGVGVASNVNLQMPSGTTRGWMVADDDFDGGEKNPCPCSDKPETHVHWLLDC